ncbi:tRNA (uracil-5-)-methyltransferase homolog A [Cylas formicarius]|uniref:tRNA (uracil-5-)-methyltransferase homolog A n=1 Tax=Cylas formicarius TaxID=197179 RepID=UPI0029588720|nr:tRNA (uracil-5-)-methyltransferase homolog A [Cylas formicarius]
MAETAASQEPKKEADPYAYLSRGEFSSENFKIEIKNLPKFYGMSEFRKLLNEKLKLNSNKIKLPRRNSPYAFVCFRNEEDRDRALNVVSELKWKGKQLQATKAKPSADPLVKKRNEDFDNRDESKRIKLDNITVEERIKLSTIPLADTTYKEQLAIKQAEIKDVLSKLGNNLARQNPELREWIDSQKIKHEGLPCELLDIKFSDVIDGYRNKCEFTVGVDEDTKLATVGFRVGAYVNGVTGVGPVAHLRHIPDAMKIAVKAFQDFVRGSALDVFNPEFQTGHFRQLCARTAPNQLMLVVGVHPQDLPLARIQEFQRELVEYFLTGGGKEARVTSLYYQEIVKKNAGETPAPATHLWGTTHVTESVLGLRFNISPEAFFQVNTGAAEVLYGAALDLASPTKDSTVLDVCCGTGTIGLCFSQRCQRVLGIEVVPGAVADANENARLNGIENAEFFAGKAEDLLGSVCFKAEGDVTAVVDPPRAGLHQKAVLQIRKIGKIDKLIYVSCNPHLAMKNFTDLGRPESKSLHGEPLVPVRAVAVDLFPHTKHCELVVRFERWDRVRDGLKGRENP